MLHALSALAAPFTYQGRLLDGPGVANGNYELRFRLFDRLSAGFPVGEPLVFPTVAVTNGLFTVQLDFGEGAFTGAPRWIELGARVSGGTDAIEVMAPRQPVLAVPYAMRALAGSGNASELTVGTVPDARLSANISRVADLTTLSNSMSARIASLEAALNVLSNQVRTLPSGGAPPVAVSANPADATLLTGGWTRFATLSAPGWSRGSLVGAPGGRVGHSAVWTGQDWLVWGGTVGGGVVSATGAAYSPASDRWSPISELDPPSARQGHSAVWTGSAMLVWGGFGVGGFLGTGAGFSPTEGAWTAIPTVNAPAVRMGHLAVWTGARMLVWGGRNATGLLADGALYDTAGKVWSPLPGANAPEARQGASAVWTGSQLLVWGGQGALGELDSGSILPVTSGITPGAWRPMARTGAPAARSAHTAVWTGSRMLIWGGNQGDSLFNSGAAFDPVANSWTAIPLAGAPTARSGHVAVWTGEEMLVVGGRDASGVISDGGAYNPATGSWRPVPLDGDPVARTQATGAWTGSEFLLFGGLSEATPVGSLQRLNPQPAWHLFRRP